MKNTHRFLVAAAALALFASAGQVMAGGTDACCKDSCCDDGIAASPKLRAMLDERKARCMASEQVTTHRSVTRQTDVAASPRVQQMREDRMNAPAAQALSETGGYRPTGADGITASPRTRAMLDEHRQTVEIAPLK